MRIGTRIMLAIIFSVALTVVGVTLMVSHEVNKALINNFTVSSKAELECMNAFVNIFFDVAISNTEILSNSQIINASLDSLPIYIDTEGGTSGSDKALNSELVAIDAMQSIMNSFPMFDALLIANSEGGITLAPAGYKFKPNYDPRQRPWYKGVAETGKVSLTSAYLRTDGKMVCSIIFPIKSADNTILGVVGSDISLETITNEIGGMRIGKTGYVLMLDDMGQVVSDRPIIDKSISKDKLWLGKNIKYLPDDVAKSLGILQNWHDEDGIVEVDFEGKIWLAAVEKTNSDWIIIMLQERDEVFADAMQITRSIFMVGILIFVIMLIIAWLVARSIAKPVEELAQASQKVADGDLKAIPADSTKYKGELGVLYYSLKTMVSKLAELVATANYKINEAEEALIISKKALAEAKKSKKLAEQAWRDGD